MIENEIDILKSLIPKMEAYVKFKMQYEKYEYEVDLSTKQGELLLQNRDHLSNRDRQIIVDHYVNNSVKMGLTDFQLIKDKIKTIFINEMPMINIPPKGNFLTDAIIS
jgi:hypothetical protein